MGILNPSHQLQSAQADKPPDKLAVNPLEQRAEKPADRTVSKPPEERPQGPARGAGDWTTPGKPASTQAEKATEKPASEEKPLALVEVISQEFDRKTKERAGLAAAKLRTPSQLPLVPQIPDPYAEVRRLLETQKKERLTLQGRTVEGTSEFQGARRNAAGAWIVTLQLRLPDDSVRFLAFAPDDAEASLRKLRLGQKVKVEGKISGTSFGGQEILSLFACTFAGLEGEQVQVDQMPPVGEPAKKPAAGEGRPLNLADIITQEADRTSTEAALRLAADSSSSREKAALVDQLNAVVRANFKAREMLQGMAATGPARFVEASRKDRGMWVAVFKVRLSSGDVAQITVSASDGEAGPILNKLRSGQNVKVKGKLQYPNFNSSPNLVSCAFTEFTQEEDDHEAILSFMRKNVRATSPLVKRRWFAPIKAISVKTPEYTGKFTPQEGMLYRLQGQRTVTDGNFRSSQRVFDYYFLVREGKVIRWQQKAGGYKAVTICKLLEDPPAESEAP
jgi:hypothetical protein